MAPLITIHATSTGWQATSTKLPSKSRRRQLKRDKAARTIQHAWRKHTKPDTRGAIHALSSIIARAKKMQADARGQMVTADVRGRRKLAQQTNECLLRLMMEADGVDTMGNVDIRAARKSVVCMIQSMLSANDRVSA